MGHYPWINRDYVKAAMLGMAKDGVKRQDRWAAALAGAWIKAFHTVCIPGSRPHRVSFHPDAHPERYVAQCATYEAYDDYPIYLPGFANNLALMSANLGFGGLSRFKRIQRAAVALAAHEVRHRVQLRCSEVRLFLPNMSGGDDILLHVMMYNAAQEIATRKDRMTQAKRLPEVIEICTNDREFDAMVIEYVIHQKYPQQKKFADLCRIIMTQPVLKS